MKNNVLKKIIAFCLVCTMIFSTSAIAFADSTTNLNDYNTGDIDTKGNLVVRVSDKDYYTMNYHNNLNNSIIYEKDSNNRTYKPDNNYDYVSIQHDLFQGMDIYSICSRIRLNESADKYSYTLDMPRGYKLVKDADYYKDSPEEVFGCILVIDSNDEIASVIEPAHSIDHTGKYVRSEYYICGNVITQTITDRDVEYPVDIIMTSHPDTYDYRKLTRTQVRTIRDSYTGSTVPHILEDGFTAIGVGAVFGSAGGVFWTMINLVANNYYTTNYSTWSKISDDFTKNYARLAFRYKWHQGHNSYYPTGNITCTYVY